MNTKKNGHIFLDIYGNPVQQNSPCLSTGYGYRAYISSEDTFINQLFREHRRYHTILKYPQFYLLFFLSMSTPLQVITVYFGVGFMTELTDL